MGTETMSQAAQDRIAEVGGSGVHVPRTGREFKDLAQRILHEEKPDEIHVLADALAVGVLHADLYLYGEEEAS